jgi:hypothetical protein
VVSTRRCNTLSKGVMHEKNYPTPVFEQGGTSRDVAALESG